MVRAESRTKRATSWGVTCAVLWRRRYRVRITEVAVTGALGATCEGERVAKDRVERDEEDLVRLYLTDIGQYMLLTKDDEVRLAKQIESGKAAVEELE
ncbi:MAG TPA: sigma-70 factor domain-containing protein, partial [Ilumatobacteraceae bacterium]|nr:sigma-70 factor domain-containing protein [Ilumatobacteraceae bacterium]